MRSLRPWLLPLGIYLTSRAVTLTLTVAATTHQTPLNADAIHVHANTTTPLRQALTGFDGQWYWTIAENGYPHHAAPGQQSALAFLPLFPTLTRPLLAAGIPFDVAGPLLAAVLGAAAVLLTHRLITTTVGPPAAITTTVALCTHPASPVLNSAYTESLALALIAATLTLIRTHRYLPAIPVIIALGYTRPVTAALIPVIAAHWLHRERAHRTHNRAAPHRTHLTVLSAATAVSALTWPATVWAITTDRHAYLTTMAAWPGFTGSPTRPPWWDAATSAHLPGVIALTSLVAALTVLATRPTVRAWGPELWAWTFGYTAFILATTSPTLSVIRYGLLAFPFALLLAPAPTAPARHWQTWAPTAAIATAGIGTQWVWLTHIYIHTGHGAGFP